MRAIVVSAHFGNITAHGVAPLAGAARCHVQAIEPIADFQAAPDRAATFAGTQSRGFAISHWNRNKLWSAPAHGLIFASQAATARGA